MYCFIEWNIMILELDKRERKEDDDIKREKIGKGERDDFFVGQCDLNILFPSEHDFVSHRQCPAPNVLSSARKIFFFPQKCIF